MGDKDKMTSCRLFVVYELADGFRKPWTCEGFGKILAVACEDFGKWYFAAVRPACQLERHSGKESTVSKSMLGNRQLLSVRRFERMVTLPKRPFCSCGSEFPYQ